MAGWRLWLPRLGNTPRSPAGAKHNPPRRPQTRATPSGRQGSAGPAGAGSDFPPPRPSSPHRGHKDTFSSVGVGAPSPTNIEDAP